MTDNPRILFVGPMLGRNPGWVTTQGEVLADLFEDAGWAVRETSRIPSRPVRLADTISCLLRWRNSVDLVLLSVFSGPAFVMADVTSSLARMLGLPVVMVLHGGDLPAFGDRHPGWVTRVLKRAIQVVAPSEFLARGAWLGQIHPTVIPNVAGIEEIQFRVREKARPDLLWMRTFHELYNPSMAVRAVGHLIDEGHEVRVTMAGQEKGLLADTRSLVSEMGLTDRFGFPGFLDAQGKAAAFGTHDIYLHTNKVDNTPVSVIEAAAAGMLIVATEVGGIPDLLEHERTALIVPDDDDAAMAAAVARFLTEPELAAAVSQNARAMALRFSWDEVRPLWSEMFRNCARTGGGPLPGASASDDATNQPG